MIELKNRRECFFDNYLIDEKLSDAQMRMHRPVRKGVLMTMDKPWEGRYTTFFNPIYAEGKWKMYYIAEVCPDEGEACICYMESDNGIDWVKPNLGIVEFEGSKDNNIILEKTKSFAIRIVKLCKYLNDKNEYILSLFFTAFTYFSVSANGISYSSPSLADLLIHFVTLPSPAL